MTHRIEIDLATGECRVVDYTPEEEAAHAAAVAANAPAEARQERLSAITALEMTITPRRLREAVMTDAGRTWLELREAEIAALRAQL